MRLCVMRVTPGSLVIISSTGVPELGPCDGLTLKFGEQDSAKAEGDEVEELTVCSAVLRLASPVFEAMFTSGMVEGREKAFRVVVASRREFHDFYGFMLPGEARAMQITETNVESLLLLSDYYQVVHLKAECVRMLCRLPASPHLLLQAHKYNLHDLFERCIEDLAREPTTDVRAFKDYPDILICLCTEVQRRLMLQSLSGR